MNTSVTSLLLGVTGDGQSGDEDGDDPSTAPPAEHAESVEGGTEPDCDPEELARLREEAAELRDERDALREERNRARERADRLEASITATAETMERAIDGDLTVRAEIGAEDPAAQDLEAVCNELIGEWAESIRRVREFSQQVSGATEQVASTAETVREKSRAVNESIREISADADRQHDHIEEVASEVEDLSATVEEVASSAEEVASAAEVSADRAQSGGEAATAALDDLEAIESTTETTLESVESLAESVGDIESIVEVIDDIAEQTNILALNASIEAARAGEEGAGFAVVADEVKSLAGETQSALEDIEGAIDAVREEADEAAADMRETRDRVGAGRETIDEALTALEDIVDDVEEVSGRVGEISNATESQAESTQQVAVMAEDVGEISEETAETADEVAAAARDQTSVLTEVQTATNTLAERTETLIDSLDDFETARSAADADSATIEMWHAMSGQKGVLLESLAREFESQYDGEVSIELTAKGSYRGTLNATLNAVENGRPPAIAQIFEIGTKRAMDSGGFVPVEDVLPADFGATDLLDPVRSYYTTDRQLYSLPFNSSTPVLCYNRTAFERAGIDPDRPPETFDAVRTAASDLVDAGVADHGISFANYAWYVEQWFAQAGQPLVDKRNGRDGDATEAHFDSEAGRVLFEWWRELETDGLYHNPGIEARGEAKSAFLDGTAAMLVASSSSLAGIEEGAREAGFELGTAPIPVADERNGLVVGGASLWVPAAIPREQQQLAGEFLAWLAEPAQQARWHRETGYFPINHRAVDALRSDGWFRENPHFETALEELLASSDIPATNGARIGPFDTVRTLVEEAYLDARDHGIETALSDLDAQVERLLENYRSR
ncbi:extracellular solute-binding protein [Halapricum hydrolyticum]|uniref:Extracellular solute-binding protein n=1 Tax=Halapricum hydrolyticum TaxID=2979991 RepID=A0AAE3LE88_9EURY|nr:extracellular solute-binding protein [Halapricum hydrolyticum]MCU4717179.1 extracellular solute-binding protein [Halapricum hydrolyticum]MCU4726106.1 extracellular solute-binding protein [Halapricum hydrolyticum]